MRTVLKTTSAGIHAAAGLSSVSATSVAENDANYGDGRTLTSSQGPNYGGGEDYDDHVEESDRAAS